MSSVAFTVLIPSDKEIDYGCDESGRTPQWVCTN